MTRQEFKQYILDHDYTEVENGLFVKKYDDKLDIQYRVNKEVVNVFYKTFNSKIKRMKARLKNLKIKSDGTLDGFKLLEKGEK